MSDMNGSSLMSEFNFTSKYAKYDKAKKRRELWDETIDRMKGMHLRKYADLGVDDEINLAFEQVKKKKILASQRAMQFGGTAIEKVNMRVYNCAVSFIDRRRAFAECFWMLLCGCGVGYSVQRRHVDHLPKLIDVELLTEEKAVYLYLVEDSIEGWANAADALISSYMIDNEHTGKNYKFDFSMIRPKGAPLSHGGKAPGPKGLKNALEKIRDILHSRVKNGFNTLRSIDAYDILCHESDAVLSGGVRRSASICLMDIDDELMIKAKTGNWFAENPQRARSNNSVVVMKNDVSREKFHLLIEDVRQFGEPGFIFLDHQDYVYNPCFHKDTRIATKEGLIRIEDLYKRGGENTIAVDLRVGKGDIFDKNKFGVEFRNASEVKLTQKNAKIFEVKFDDGRSIKVTDNHEFPTTIGRKKLSDLSVGDSIYLQSCKSSRNITEEMQLPVHESGVFEKNEDYIRGCEFARDNFALSIFEKINCPCLDKPIPEFVWSECQEFLVGFVSNLVCRDVSFNLAKELQILHSHMGGRTKIVKSENGFKLHRNFSTTISIVNIEYVENDDVYCLYEESSNSLIANGIIVGNCAEIGMCPIAIYRPTDKEKISKLPDKYKSYCEVSEGFMGPLVENYTKEILSERSKFERHGFVYKSGWQVCNLCELNGKAIRSLSDFKHAVHHATVIGTCQAGFTDHGYLKPESQHIIEREALLGISITGVQDSRDVILNEENQREMAKYAIEVNRAFAKRININSAARITTVKPAGNSSILLQCGSGIHAHHARRYFRRVQVNKDDNVLAHFKKFNPHAVIESVWSVNRTDEVITFPIEVGPEANTKEELTALELLNHVLMTQKNWIIYGTAKPNSCEGLFHNVSNTVNVRKEEWDDVANFLYDNRQFFSGISLLPTSGDKVYHQAPMEACYFRSELVDKYGEDVIYHAERIYDTLDRRLVMNSIQDIRFKFTSMEGIYDSYDRKWKWIQLNCSPMVNEHQDVIEYKYEYEARCEYEYTTVLAIYKDMKRHITTNGVNTALDILASVNDEQRWKDLVDKFKNVDYSILVENEDKTDLQGEVACAGGACELSFVTPKGK